MLYYVNLIMKNIEGKKDIYSYASLVSLRANAKFLRNARLNVNRSRSIIEISESSLSIFQYSNKNKNNIFYDIQS